MIRVQCQFQITVYTYHRLHGLSIRAETEGILKEGLFEWAAKPILKIAEIFAVAFFKF